MMMKQRQVSSSGRSRCGAAMVEKAVVLPLFLILVLGIIEFGRAMMVMQLITNGAREGARMAAMDGNSNTDVDQFIRDFVQATVNLNPSDITITISVTPASGNPQNVTDVGSAAARDEIEIAVSVPFNKVTFLTPVKFLAGKNISSKSLTRHQ